MSREETEQTKKRVSLRTNVFNYFHEYCSSTSIHGFRYFGEQRTIFEKLWWIVFFALCLTGLVLSITVVYKKWDDSPVIVTFATKPVPILNIPFPAITICSESKLKANSYNFSELLDKNKRGATLTTNETKVLNYLANVCDIETRQLSNLQPLDFLDVLEGVTPSYFPTNCVELGIMKQHCEELFTPLLTDDGLCYTFNILDRQEMFNENVVHYKDFHVVSQSATNWSTEDGYSADAGIDTYPRRALLSGGRYAFSFDLVTIKQEIFPDCKDAVQGYKASFNSPARIPRVTQRYFRIPLDNIVAATIRPSMINTSATVKQYPPAKRECYFPGEKKLRYFKTYTQGNCNMECLTNSTLRNCECVHFSMPRENGTRLCGGRDLACINKAEYTVQVARLIQNVNVRNAETEDISDTEREELKQIACGCLPLCSDVDYNTEVSQTYWNWSRKKGAFRNLSENDYHLSRLTVFFLSGDFIPSERNQLYGPLDFLANFGGLLGLFTGFSILSLIEIIYFLTLRLVCNIQMYGHWWTGYE